MKKIMISQPMAGITQAEIETSRNRAIKFAQENNYEFVNTLFTDEWYMDKRGVVHISICFLAKSIENMSLCHVAYFCKGWEEARGCKIEHDVAKAYGLEIVYEDDSDNVINIDMPENISREEMDKIIEEVEEERKARIEKAINSYK